MGTVHELPQTAWVKRRTASLQKFWGCSHEEAEAEAMQDWQWRNGQTSAPEADQRQITPRDTTNHH